MIRFEDLLDRVRGYNPDADLELLRRAYVFSALEHKGQVRHSGEPYLVHKMRWNIKPVTLKADEYYLIGDNRGMPQENHTFGKGSPCRAPVLPPLITTSPLLSTSAVSSASWGLAP